MGNKMMEIVEYKSKGHPDTLTDMVVENCALKLEKYYIEKYGRILHYNLDKALFLAGEAKRWYGSGVITKLPTFILGGQAANLGEEAKGVLREAVYEGVRNILPKMQVFNIEIRTGNVSANLDKITTENLCNDTSFGVGYYPYSANENLVLLLAEYLGCMSDEIVGRDFKILLSPVGINVSIGFYAQAVQSEDDYRCFVGDLESLLTKKAGRSVKVNPEGPKFPYLTLMGSSIECGDDGQVGRSNRYNGLITPFRPMTIEAYYGKNNQTHIGRLYQKIAFEEAKKYYEVSKRPVEVYLVNQIGRPIQEYQLNIQIKNSE